MITASEIAQVHPRWLGPPTWIRDGAARLAAAWFRDELTASCEHAPEPSRGGLVYFDTHAQVLRCGDCHAHLAGDAIGRGAFLVGRTCDVCLAPATQAPWAAAYRLLPGFVVVVSTCPAHGPDAGHRDAR